MGALELAGTRGWRTGQPIRWRDAGSELREGQFVGTQRECTHKGRRWLRYDTIAASRRALISCEASRCRGAQARGKIGLARAAHCAASKTP